MTGQALPTGRVTLLFTDIEGSTRLLDALGDRFGDLVAEHRKILRDAVARNGGTEVGTQGDGHTAAFTDVAQGIRAAVDAQLALRTHTWPEDLPVRVRMGLHTGDVAFAREEYYGMGLHAAARVSSAAHGGQILVSEDAHAAIGERLAPLIGFDDLGLHSLKDLGAPSRLFQVVHAELEREFPPPASLTVLPNNLPTMLPNFIGRETEIAALVERLRDDRLVTITGPGGVGKTRTALQVAAELVDRFAHGVWFVDLAALRRDDVVARAVANALSVRDEPGRSLQETLQEKLRSREVLLLIDNCEHVIDECAASVASLLRACPRVTVLATSRETLDVPGEAVFDLEPFSVIEDDSSAVTLFMDRAAAVGVKAFSSEDRVRIAEICRRVDGLALAIELAAARSDVLSAEQIAERLAQPRFLSGRGRGVPDRQRSLDALIDWSFGLLGPAERLVLRRCAVFAGGFTLEAAEAVCGGEGLEVIDALSSLTRASLLVVGRREHGIRYRLLETVRAFALERLTEAGERRSASEAHATYFATLSRRLQSDLDGPRQAELLDVLTREFGNLTGAIEFAIAEDVPDPGICIVDALRRFWIDRGHLHAVLDWTRRLSALSSPSSFEAELLLSRGFFEGIAGDGDAGVASVRRALEMAASRNDEVLEERANVNLGSLLERRGELEEAEQAYMRSVEHARRLGDRLSEASALGNLGNVAFRRDDFERCERFQFQALDLAEAAGAPRVVSNTLSNLGLVAWIRGDLDAAMERFERALVIAREVGSAALPQILGNIGGLARDLGDVVRGKAALREAIDLSERAGDPEMFASNLVSLGTVLWDAGEFEEAKLSWVRGLDVARTSGLPTEELTALLNLAELAADEGDLDRAESLATEMLDLARASQSPRREADALAILAELAQRRSAFDEAEALARRSRGLFEQIEDTQRVADASATLADVLISMNRLDEALHLLDEAERESDPTSWRLVTVLQLRCRIALERGDNEAAAHAAARLEEAANSAPVAMRAEALRVVADVRSAADVS